MGTTRLWLPAPTWMDMSPHRSDFVTVNGVNVAHDVNLHYLDWGGEGEPLLFLAGMGNSAHIFDELAPRFTDRFRVLALTRRGHGRSDRPEVGYDLDTLVGDIQQFCDALQLARVTLVGHSMAGDELTCFAGRFPERVAKLVYLDAALDHSRLQELDAADPVRPPTPTEEEFASLDNIRQWLQTQFGFWSHAQEADLRETVTYLGDGSVRVGLPPRIGEALLAGLSRCHPDYSAVRAPALAFYAVVHTHPLLAMDADEKARAAAQQYVDEVWRPWQQAEIERFRQGMANSRVVELHDAHHHLFLDCQEEVIHEMRAFLLGE
jgi:non-heme chloroperoxidase